MYKQICLKYFECRFKSCIILPSNSYSQSFQIVDSLKRHVVPKLRSLNSAHGGSTSSVSQFIKRKLLALVFIYSTRFASGEGNFRMESIRGIYTTACLLNSLRFPPFHLIKFRDTGKLLQAQQERDLFSVMPSLSFVQLNIKKYAMLFIPLHKNTKLDERFFSTILKL
jgi:hypothetical protein